jgi:hypothetical protein
MVSITLTKPTHDNYNILLDFAFQRISQKMRFTFFYFCSRFYTYGFQAISSSLSLMFFLCSWEEGGHIHKDFYDTLNIMRNIRVLSYWNLPTHTHGKAPSINTW